MWIILAFVSAFLLGCYDVNKKLSLNGNAVIPVLFLNTLFSTLLLMPFVGLSYTTTLLQGSLFEVPHVSWVVHLQVFIKSCIVLSSWLFGYFGLKHLPITLVGPMKATQPILTLTGALLIFGEHLNVYQSIGVSLAIFSLFHLSRSGKQEGIRFMHNKWILFSFLGVLFGAFSGIYDKYLMQRLDVMTVQVWFTFYQCLMMLAIVLFIWYPQRQKSTPFHWRWNIIFISLFLCIADWIYFYALSDPKAMISIISMVRRSNVLVTFAAGALFFHEKNLKRKTLDLLLVFISMIFIYIGTY